MKYVLLGLIFIGFLALFLSMYLGKVVERFYRKTKTNLQKTGREKLLQFRESLLMEQEKKRFWNRVERYLYFSGMKRHFPWLSGPLFVTIVCCLECVVVIASIPFGIQKICLGVVVVPLGLVLLFLLLRRRELQQTAASLMSFLDFLGNYSVTAGEITWIFEQMIPYMREPIKSALEECVVEAKLTGDVGMALLAMGDRVEHVQFREIVRNLEIGIRYLADFKSLVETCKRSLREYEKSLREEKAMVGEAWINMGLLLGMSTLALLIVDNMMEQSVWYILFHTWIGKGAFGLVIGIMAFFVFQVLGMEK